MTAETKDNEHKEEPPQKERKKLWCHPNKVIAYNDASDNSDIQPYYSYHCALTELVILKLHVTKI